MRKAPSTGYFVLPLVCIYALLYLRHDTVSLLSAYICYLEHLLMYGTFATKDYVEKYIYCKKIIGGNPCKSADN